MIYICIDCGKEIDTEKDAYISTLEADSGFKNNENNNRQHLNCL